MELTKRNLFLFFILVVLVVSIEAHIKEFDEVWKKRAHQAKKAARHAYNPNPKIVLDHLNYQVNKLLAFILPLKRHVGITLTLLSSDLLSASRQIALKQHRIRVPNRIAELLHSHSGRYLFKGVTREILLLLVADMKAEYIPPREDIIMQNESPGNLYIIVSREVEMIESKMKNEQTPNLEI